MFSKFLHRVLSALVLTATVLLASAPQMWAADAPKNLAAWKTTAFFGLSHSVA